MATKNIVMSFQLREGIRMDEDVLKTIRSMPGLCLEGELNSMENKTVSPGTYVLLSTNQSGNHVVVHCYDNGMITVDVQQFFPEVTKDPLHDEITTAKQLEMRIRDSLGDLCKFSRCLPGMIKRGEITPYFSSGNDALFEYENIELVFEKDSKWQNIKIYHNPDVGNFLCLDDDIMIGESDLIYTETLLGVTRNDFRDKTVLILGGGDGGLLYELLKQKPTHVLMVEIDEEVVKACRTHMRRVCESAMDSLEGPNYKIQFDDCAKVLEECRQQGRKFDYVINDLSEYLINAENTKFAYDYNTTCVILEMSLGVLHQNGKYLSRGNIASATSYLRKYEEDMGILGMTFQKFKVFVPSFKEDYFLYEVWRGSES
ncbi:spermine synthase-like [Ostrea edulis]|uniref:spermine synthase-like n=1 Tax=Ostrea edulis TaxID=37623 RepID=UPI0024AEAF45|nr:spermine synthase-like [Ostrea edulis]XP_048750485.2 spermine synthase-like [Ostrea edulis]XP_048750487.2 spermine synthase-like [Ostrea edulis]XP_048750488.2 spermine synthase-like [Ostrea edulis]XP_048750489.2 spermine synthase-like [Ostrea edulis]XP_048750490.2 spermine synthase-like [Ostrea edulis]XP_048750491.2 spermine synthase-like [Ostrea edulis]XP_056001927.1 spermine synthase-like [Ostrea edulis]XP_056001928.1 spermine synthase-like [Ostrea edulis]XP_056001930.1 spermine synth